MPPTNEQWHTPSLPQQTGSAGVCRLAQIPFILQILSELDLSSYDFRTKGTTINHTVKRIKQTIQEPSGVDREAWPVT